MAVWGRVDLGIRIFLAVGLPAISIGIGASWSSAILGGAAWLVAGVLKVPSDQLIKHWVDRERRVSLFSAIQGIASAASELGIAAICFVLWLEDARLLDIVAFGAGASTLEIGLTLLAGAAESRKQGTTTPASQLSPTSEGSSWCVRLSAAIERLVTTFLHIGSRGLIWLWVTRGQLGLGVAAIVGFSLVDGVATYAIVNHWDWLSPRTCRRFYAFVAIVGILELLLLGWGW